MRRHPSTRRRKSAREAWIEVSKTSRDVCDAAASSEERGDDGDDRDDDRGSVARESGDEEGARPAARPAKKIKSRSGQRKKKTTNAAEALKDIGTNAVNAEEDGVNAEEEAAREGSGDVFDLLRGENSAAMLFSNDCARYNASEIAAVAEIYSLLCKAAGCTTGVSAMELQRSDCLTIMNRIVNDMASGNLFGEDPLSKRSQDFKGFRENFLEFIDKCVRNTSEGEELYDGTLFASYADLSPRARRAKRARCAWRRR